MTVRRGDTVVVVMDMDPVVVRWAAAAVTRTPPGTWSPRESPSMTEKDTAGAGTDTGVAAADMEPRTRTGPVGLEAQCVLQHTT
jgi:hypothetical protein